MGQTVNLGSGVETSIREVADLVFDVVPGARIDPVFQPPRPGDVRRHAAGIAKARKMFGFEPRVSIPEGIERLVRSLRAKGDIAGLLTETQAINWVTSDRPVSERNGRDLGNTPP